MIENLLSRLKKVRKTGVGSWVACCPAHQDKTPSLSITQTQDGRILLHCFAECAANDVLAAIGLEMGDLFPEGVKGQYGPTALPFSPLGALQCIAKEALIVVAAAATARKGALAQPDMDRLLVAARRINEAVEAVHGR